MMHSKGFDDGLTELQLAKTGYVFSKPVPEHESTGEDTSILHPWHHALSPSERFTVNAEIVTSLNNERKIENQKQYSLSMIFRLFSQK